MSVPLVVLGVLVAVTVAAYLAAAPMTYGARRRRIARRRRWVAHHPDAAKAHDVVDLLRRSGLLMREARDLAEMAAVRGVRSVTLYRWLNRMDDDVRVTVLRAGLSNSHLVDHVGQGTLPDLPGVREFAEAQGLAVAPAEVTQPPRASTPPSSATEDHAAETAAPESGAVETPEDAERHGSVVIQAAPVISEPAAREQATLTSPAPSPAAASAILLGARLGTQTPVPRPHRPPTGRGRLASRRDGPSLRLQPVVLLTTSSGCCSGSNSRTDPGF